MCGFCISRGRGQGLVEAGQESIVFLPLLLSELIPELHPITTTFIVRPRRGLRLPDAVPLDDAQHRYDQWEVWRDHLRLGSHLRTSKDAAGENEVFPGASVLRLLNARLPLRRWLNT